MSDDDQVTGQTPQVEEPIKQQGAEMPTAEETLLPEPEGEGLPETASERTQREFEKLKESNRRLKEELDATRKAQDYGESVYSAFTPKKSAYVSGTQDHNPTQDFVDADGNVDVAGLNSALKDANERARQAFELANAASERTRQAEEARQVAEAHEKHGWLNPQSDVFDPIAYDAVVARMARYMQQGKEPSLAKVADEVKSAYRPRPISDVAKKQAVDDYKQAQATRAQVSVADGKGQPRQETVRTDELRSRSLDGDVSALDERIRLATGA